MQRITISIDDDLLGMVDDLCEKRGYGSRSEAFRDLLRAGFAQSGIEDTPAGDAVAPCFATLSYVYDHHTRDLARRLNTSHHHHHGLSVATTHVHIDDDVCLEVAILKGGPTDLKAFAASVTSQRGVRHGNLHVIPAETAGSSTHHHEHGHDHEGNHG